VGAGGAHLLHEMGSLESEPRAVVGRPSNKVSDGFASVTGTYCIGVRLCVYDCVFRRGLMLGYDFGHEGTSILITKGKVSGEMCSRRIEDLYLAIKDQYVKEKGNGKSRSQTLGFGLLTKMVIP
jgi:hypothetical protein